MRALFYEVRPIGWATCWWLKRFRPRCLVSRLNGLSLRDVAPPELPGRDWVRVRTTMAGICGSDLALLAQKQPPDSILQAFSSMPAGFGHENLAAVEEAGPDVDRSWIGRRVCVEPTLGCTARGIEPPCASCREGRFGACMNFAAPGGRYGLPPGTSIGYNARTGGSFGEAFVAHVSQLVPVPDAIGDELAILTDPAACALHAALRADLGASGRVLVYGAGVLGLALIACLRAIGFAGRIEALDVQDWLGELARGLGADEFVKLPRPTRQRFEAVAARTGATVQRARFGNHMLSGGYDAVFECTGARSSIDESLRWTRSGGKVVLVGTGHGRGVDLTPIWFTELTVIGAYGRQIETFAGRRIGTYQLVHELMAAGKLPLGRLLTHKFRLEDYREAFWAGLNKSAYKAVKVAFDLR
jgi:threonine dehydrogenase-like Zn-dependent dehydrogenase